MRWTRFLLIFLTSLLFSSFILQLQSVPEITHVFVWFDVHFTARLPQDDKTSTMKQHRHKELELRKKNYRWAEATLPLLLLQIII